MGPVLFDDSTESEGSASALSSTPNNASKYVNRGGHSPNVASQRKAMRETRRHGDENAADDASMELGQNSRRRGNSRRQRRRNEKSISSTSESSWSSQSSSELRSSLSSRLSAPRRGGRHARRRYSGGAAATARSPARQPPASPHQVDRRVSLTSEESGFHSLLYKSEDRRLPIYIPAEPVAEEKYFPLRKPVAQPQLSYKPIRRASTPPPIDRGVTSQLSSISMPPPPPPPPPPPVPTSTPPPEPEEEEDDVDVPLWLTRAASDEMMETDCLKQLLRPEGLEIPSCTTLLKTNRYLLESFPATLYISRQEPILLIKNSVDNKLRLLMPDPVAEPICQTLAFGSNGNPLGQFNGYEFPLERSGKNDMETIELRLSSRPGVLGWFRNMRVPCWFEIRDDKTATQLQKALIIVRRALNTAIANESERQAMHLWKRPPCLPPPTVLNGAKKQHFLSRLRPEHFDLETKTGNLLDDASRRLVTSRSVANFWKTEVKSWCTFYSFGRVTTHSPANGPRTGGKWKRVHLRLWIHPYTGDLMITDKDGAVLGPIIDVSSYSPATTTFKDTSAEVPTDIAVTNKAAHLTYMTFYDAKPHVQEDRIWLAFESLEKLKDFQQTVATVVYLKNRRRYLTSAQIEKRTDLELF